MDRNQDRNLLFAVLAVQLKGISPEVVLEEACAWSLDRSRDLPERFQARGVLTKDDILLLNSFVDKAVESCGNNAGLALSTVYGAQAFKDSLLSEVQRRVSSSGTTLEMAPDHLVDQVILSPLNELPGRYTLISEQGRGGMGRVLLVHDQHMGRNVALKEVLIPHDTPQEASGEKTHPSPMRETSGRLARFVQEARITSHLEHPSIVPVYELGRRVNGTFYYTMKLVRGHTLLQSLRGRPQLRDRLALLPHLIDACQALSYAHSRGVIHRDVKPANIMTGEFGETVLLDWGVAMTVGHPDFTAEKLRESLHLLKIDQVDELEKTKTGTALGTPHYMPPEQALGKIDEIDHRSDVYGAGAVLYEILTGSPPFEGRDAKEILWKVTHTPIRRIEELAPEAPPELVSICMKALQREQAERYQSMKALTDELVRFQTGALVRSHDYSPAQVIQWWLRKYRKPLQVLGSGAVAAALLLTYSYVSIWRARDSEQAQRIVAEQERGRAEQSQYVSQLHLASTHLEDHELSLANAALWSTPPARRDWVWGLLLNKANPERVSVNSSGMGYYQVQYFPIGDKLIALPFSHPPQVLDGSTGALLLQLEGTSGKYQNPRFDSAAARLAALRVDGSVEVWDLKTGQRLGHFAQDTPAADIAFAPDSNRLWGALGGGKVVAWDVTTGEKVKELSTTLGEEVIALAVDQSGLLLSMSRPKPEARPLGQGTVQAWREDSTLPALQISGRWAEFAGEGLLLVAGNAGKMLSLFDVATGAALHHFGEHADEVFATAQTGDKRCLAVAYAGGQVRVFDLRSGRLEGQFNARAEVKNLHFVKGDTGILACTIDNQYLVWDRVTGIEQFRINGEGRRLHTASVRADTTAFAAVGSGQIVQIFDVAHPTGHRAVSGRVSYPPGVNSLLLGSVLSADGAIGAAHWSSGVVAVYDVQRQRRLAHLQQLLPIATQLALSKNGSVLVACLDGFTPLVLTTEDMQQKAAYDEHERAVYALALGAEGDICASGGEAGEVHLWNTATGKEITRISAPSAVQVLGLQARGEAVLGGGEDGVVRRWQVPDGVLTHEFRAHEGRVLALALDQSGQKLATTGADGAISLWNAQSLTRLASTSLREPMAFSRASRVNLNFTADSRYLIVTGTHLDSKIFDTQRMELVYRNRESERLMLSPDLKTALFFDRGETIRAVDLPDWTPPQGSTTGWEWQARFDAYKRSYAVSVPSAAGAPAMDVTIVGSDEFDKLLELLRQTGSEQTDAVWQSMGGVPVTAQWPSGLRGRFAVQEGDIITGVGGDIRGEKANLGDTLDALRTEVASGTVEQVALQLQRKGADYHVLLHILPTIHAEAAWEADSEDLLSLIAGLRDRTKGPAVSEMSQEEGRLEGVLLMEDWLGILDAEVVERCGLSQFDHVEAVNGVDVTERIALHAELERVRSMLGAGEGGVVQLKIRRGLGTRLMLSVNAIP